MQKVPAKYVHTAEYHNLDAPSEIVPVLLNLFDPSSVVDYGCGTGTFLHVFNSNGVKDILGLDGEWVDKSQLFIPEEYLANLK